jgi:hypothetical protein
MNVFYDGAALVPSRFSYGTYGGYPLLHSFPKLAWSLKIGVSRFIAVLRCVRPAISIEGIRPREVPSPPRAHFKTGS